MSRFKNEVAHLKAHVTTLRRGGAALFTVGTAAGPGLVERAAPPHDPCAAGSSFAQHAKVVGRAIAIFTTYAPGSAHCATTFVFVFVLYRRRVSAFSLVIVST